MSQIDALKLMRSLPRILEDWNINSRTINSAFIAARNQVAKNLCEQDPNLIFDDLIRAYNVENQIRNG